MIVTAILDLDKCPRAKPESGFGMPLKRFKIEFFGIGWKED
jgi:hypothetical protein